MNQYAVVSWLLKQSFSPEISNFITWIYMIVLSSQKTKPGQTVFESPCGHLLKYVVKSKLKSFTCPLNKEIYLFERDMFDREFYYMFELSEPYIFLDLVEEYDHEYRDGINCGICNKVYYTSSVKSDMKAKIVCHCGKFVDKFPCKTCPKKRCRVPGCTDVNYEKMNTELCRDHYRCKTCKDPLSYDHYTPCHEGCCDGWIGSKCKKCKYEKSIDFEWSLLPILFPDLWQQTP
uniref:Uncharacterized protein n=1 Tax=viral metagenome TaxID=1070528 RepID=A0A6C0C804_9ZZZZ